MDGRKNNFKHGASEFVVSSIHPSTYRSACLWRLVGVVLKLLPPFLGYHRNAGPDIRLIPFLASTDENSLHILRRRKGGKQEGVSTIKDCYCAEPNQTERVERAYQHSSRFLCASPPSALEAATKQEETALSASLFRSISTRIPKGVSTCRCHIAHAHAHAQMVARTLGDGCVKGKLCG